MERCVTKYSIYDILTLFVALVKDNISQRKSNPNVLHLADIPERDLH